MTHGRHSPALAGAILALALGGGCATGEYYESRPAVIESRSHADGQVLAQRKLKMRRAQQDLVHVRATLQNLRRHRDAAGLDRLAPFVRTYLDDYVSELLSRESGAWHPELVPLDANLHFAAAAVRMELGDRLELERLIGQIEQRFEDSQSLLVEYPIGEQSTLGQALEALKRERWKI